jgi:hypothetical protein
MNTSIPTAITFKFALRKEYSTTSTGEHDDEGIPILLTDHSRYITKVICYATVSDKNSVKDTTFMVSCVSGDYPADEPIPENLKNDLMDIVRQNCLKLLTEHLGGAVTFDDKEQQIEELQHTIGRMKAEAALLKVMLGIQVTSLVEYKKNT